MAQLNFELVSPEKLLVSRPVALVTVPGGEGDYGVLPGHAPMITTVRPGVIEIFDQMDSLPVERIFVSGGFAEVTGERCTVLADEAVRVADLSAEELREASKNLAGAVAAATAEAERMHLIAQQEIVAAKLQAAA
jgi:F-type H+-transporting ATPase subunit epsilon